MDPTKVALVGHMSGTYMFYLPPPPPFQLGILANQCSVISMLALYNSYLQIDFSQFETVGENTFNSFKTQWNVLNPQNS